MRLGRVFISSVFGGLVDLRAQAAAAARLAGLEPVLTEYQIAQPGPVREALSREIASCDTYVGLFDTRRGSVPDSGTHDHRAITEEELALAREWGLRCLVFLSRAEDGEREPGLAQFLAREVTDYASGVWARYYGTPADLRREMVAALAALRPRVVLALGCGAGRCQATLHLSGVVPAWKGAARLGPVPATLGVSPAAANIVAAFRAGTDARNGLDEAALCLAGKEIARAVLPGPLAAALDDVLDLAAGAGRLLTLEVRTGDLEALALPWELLSLSRHGLPVREGLVEIVRRFGEAGAGGGPGSDPAPVVPAMRLTVLGFTSAPLEDQAGEEQARAGGLADADLFWEREQERLLVAFDALLREGRGSLLLPETGDREDLRVALARRDRAGVVHVASHGGAVDAPGGRLAPALLLENADGRRASLTAPELLRWVRTTPDAAEIELLVLAACWTVGAPVLAAGEPGLRMVGTETARTAVVEGTAATAKPATGSEAAGLAEALVTGGMARVLGMQGSISDEGATAFVEGFYRWLARGTDLPTALRAGRAELAAHGLAHEWAVPALLVRRDAGPLVAPEGSAPPAATPLELTRLTFGIAGVSYLEQGYVGRRDAERRLRRAWQRGEHVLVVHGLGGIGKSTLAARFLDRRLAEGARVLVLYAGRRLAPQVLWDDVAAAVEVDRPAGLPPEEAEGRFRAAVGQALAAVSSTVLLLDNFEDNQDGEGRLHDPKLGEALVDLSIAGGQGFRLLITSRYAVELPGPTATWNLDLGELSPSGCRKLRLLDREGLGSLDEGAWQQVLRHLGGHPKALELLGGYLRGRPDRVRALLASFGQALDSVDRQLAAERQRRGRRLLVETVLAEVPDERRRAFDRLCLLDQPLPTDELVALLTSERVHEPFVELSWLRDRGLLARTIASSAIAGGDAVHRLLASRRLRALAEREGEEAARSWHVRVAEHYEKRGGPLSDLGAAARHRDAAGDRTGALRLYGRWARAVHEPGAISASQQIAGQGLVEFPPGEREAERVAAAELWLLFGDGWDLLDNDAKEARSLEEALALLAGAESTEARFVRASALLRRGGPLARAGTYHEAAQQLAPIAADLQAGLDSLGAEEADFRSNLGLRAEQERLWDQIGDLHLHARFTAFGAAGNKSRLREALELYEDVLKIYERIGARPGAPLLRDVESLLAQLRLPGGAVELGSLESGDGSQRSSASAEGGRRVNETFLKGLACVLPRLRNPLGFVGLVSLMIAVKAPHTLPVRIAVGVLGVNMIVFGQIFHFLGLRPAAHRTKLLSKTLVLFCVLTVVLVVTTLFLAVAQAPHVGKVETPEDQPPGGAPGAGAVGAGCRLSAGSDAGGVRAARLYSLIASCRLQGQTAAAQLKRPICPPRRPRPSSPLGPKLRTPPVRAWCWATAARFQAPLAAW
jgi:hypothetical protein